jgi:NAD(P)-dependent dehydrogenase (short-subunit alcohol dehydrogenase family)
MDVVGRVAVVTGAGSGVGEVVAEHLARTGALVLVADIDADLAAEVAARCAAMPGAGRGVAVRADVLRPEDRDTLLRRAVELGGPHVLVNNAGGWGPSGRQFPTASTWEWRDVVELNLLAPMELTQACLPVMQRLGGGVVVNIASSAGRESTPYRSPEYAAAKAGLVRFTTAVAGIAAGFDVRVNCVVPNWIGLPRAVQEWEAMSAAERAALASLIPPDDVATAVADLVADDSLNGGVVLLEGGQPRQVL